jgi:hypothetical protein
MDADVRDEKKVPRTYETLAILSNPQKSKESKPKPRFSDQEPRFLGYFKGQSWSASNDYDNHFHLISLDRAKSR